MIGCKGVTVLHNHRTGDTESRSGGILGDAWRIVVVPAF